MEDNTRTIPKEIKFLFTNADTLTNKTTELDERAKACWPDVIAINEVKPKTWREKNSK